MRVLHIVSSPRGDDSASIATADAFFERLRERVPDAEVDVLDAWAERLPEFDVAALRAKRKATRGQDLTAEEDAVWRSITALVRRFAVVDRIPSRCRCGTGRTRTSCSS